VHARASNAEAEFDGFCFGLSDKAKLAATRNFAGVRSEWQSPFNAASARDRRHSPGLRVATAGRHDRQPARGRDRGESHRPRVLSEIRSVGRAGPVRVQRALRLLCRRRRATFRGNPRTSQGCHHPGEIPFPILLDRKQAVFHAFGATQETTTTIVLRPNHHVIAILKGAARTQALDALAVVERLAAERKPTPIAAHPPVLIVPDVLGQEDCRRLITIYDTRGNVQIPHGPGLDHLAGSDYKMRIPEHSRQDRIDHIIFDKGTSNLPRSAPRHPTISGNRQGVSLSDHAL
jgi:hypothetical protein